jgi:hypothetical protein
MREGQKACSQNKKRAAREMRPKKFAKNSLIPAKNFAPGTLRREGEKEESE